MKLLTLLLVLFFLPCAAQAKATAASVQNFLPAIDDSRYFSIYSSQTLQRWQFRTGLYFNYARNPLEIGVAGQGRAFDHLIMTDIFGSIGITDWFQVGLNVPVAVWGKAYNFFTDTETSAARMGDVRLDLKLRLVDIDRWKVGLSLLPFATFPTGDGNFVDQDVALSSIGRMGVGNNSFAGGAKVLLDFDILRRAQIALNLGYVARDNVVIVGTRQDDFFTYGLGVNVIATEWMHIIAEAQGQTVTTEFFKRQRELPFEVGGGFRFLPRKPEGLQISLGGTGGLTFGYGTPDFRILAGISYMKPRVVKLQEEPIEPVEVLAKIEKKAIVITRKVHFEYDKSVIRPVSFPILDAIADILDQNRDILKVRIEGHTDFLGTDKYNMKLSQGRANAVRAYLLSKGIAAERLIAVGYGESRPIDTNETAFGRARNRRVEFIILEQEGLGEELPGEPGAAAPQSTAPDTSDAQTEPPEPVEPAEPPGPVP